MGITRDVPRYVRVITGNQVLMLRTRNYGYREGTKVPHPRGLRNSFCSGRFRRREVVQCSLQLHALRILPYYVRHNLNITADIPCYVRADLVTRNYA